MKERRSLDGGSLRVAVVLVLVGVAGLCALGRFRSAVALTLGAAVAIVSALWLSDLVGRFDAPRQGAVSRLDWKFGLKACLRYGIVGLALYGAVRMLPAEVPWIVVGLSTGVASVVMDGIREHRRGLGSTRRT